MVSPSATSPLITLQTWKEWALRTCTGDHFQGQVIADIIIDEGYNATAFMVQDTPYGIGIELVVTEILEAANVTIVATIRYDEAANFSVLSPACRAEAGQRLASREVISVPPCFSLGLEHNVIQNLVLVY
ncbi:unnamed protein product [marine sediment metagenome]|uniref:Uncharacterized protein n=1 Tax=marine sediment metagenome TaxID=412755 RepID=X1P2E9_9ZZZZ